MKALLFDRIGHPSEVLYLGNLEIPKVKDNEILVRIIGSSINPGDFLFIQNLYPKPKNPKFPGQIGGNHGAGVVTEVGKNTNIKRGTLVAFSYYNIWAEYAAIPEEWLIELPGNYPFEKASQFVNLISAWDLLKQSNVKKGGWLAVTSGNSAVSIMVTQFARITGINVISIVRKTRKGQDAPATGASAIIDLSAIEKTIANEINLITDGNGVNGIIDNVGGPLLAELIKSAAFGSKIIINGGMSEETFTLHNFDILLKGIEIKPHVYRYFFTPPQSEDKSTLDKIIALSHQPDFYTPVGGIYRLDQYTEAIKSAESPSLGKIFFSFSDE